MKDVPGERRLGIAAFAKDASVLLQVSDTGVGIPAEKREKLFDPFFTTKASGGRVGAINSPGHSPSSRRIRYRRE